ncbi:5-oxoprolinase subunit B/C family protein [Microbacterium sp. GXF0217]
MRVLRASARAVLVEAADLDEAMRVNLVASDVFGIVERVPAARTVLVRFDPLLTTADALAEALVSMSLARELPSDAAEVTVPVRYDGEDLDEVAGLLEISAEDLVNRHLAAHWRVAFSGFAPGFGYLVGDDPLFDVPRRSSPRTRVPAGAVGLAGEFTGVYPRESPGGWQLIGRTDAVMWDIDRDPPALLAPGARVRFERAAATASVLPTKRMAAQGHAHDRAIEVVSRSLQLLVQDAGRPGLAALGVSASGAADRTAMRDANRAVGNARDAAVLECVGGVELRLRGAGVAVVTGATGELEVTDAAGIARRPAHGSPFATADGDLLRLGHPERGIRYVIGVRGGVVAASALGSSATDILAGLGPRPLTVGDVVGVGDAAVAAVDEGVAPRALPAPGELVELGIALGPRDDWFTTEALAVLTGQEWLVTAQSDRVGVRLHGEIPLARAIQGELPSEGAVTGAIQVPPDGQPVVFGPDHPTTGGYPVVAALAERALDMVAQLPPGARVRFRVS